MTFDRIRRSVAEFLEHAVVPREMFFRSGDRFHHLRFSVRSQQVLIVGAFLAVAWGLYATVSYGVHLVAIAGKDSEISQQRLAYFDLLSEVGEYHTQFSRITRDLEENQAYLLSVLEQNPSNEKEFADIQKQLKGSETEHARVFIAREGLRARMEQFETELLQMAGENISLQSQLAQMRGRLEVSKAERDQGAAAREQLVATLSEVESALDRTAGAKRGLEDLVATLQSELSGSEFARQALTERKSQLTNRIAGLEQEFGTTRAERDKLKEHIAGLDGSLAEASNQTARLEEQRDLLERRVGGLEQQIVDLRDAGLGVIERLSERTRLSVEVIEKTVAMTGLDVDSLIAQVDHSLLGQGGPFVPAGTDVASFAPSTQLGSTVSLLEDNLDRWSALRVLLARLPLTSPLDQYRISSGYGARRDPINGRKARHWAVDFAAPTGSSVYTTAPGKVVFAGWRGHYGRTIEIDHGHGVRTRYAHLRKILVKRGDEVEHRQKIGLVGSSGRSTGPHVHYEVRYKNKARNPMKFLKAGKYVFKG